MDLFPFTHGQTVAELLAHGGRAVAQACPLTSRDPRAAGTGNGAGQERVT